MEKVILNYESSNGTIRTDDGHVVGNWIGLKPMEAQSTVSVSDLIELRGAGYDVDEISSLRRKGLI